MRGRTAGRLLVGLFIGTGVFLCFVAHTWRCWSSFTARARLGNNSKNLNQSPYLNIATHIYVISLPRRLDRRKDMERLRAALGLQWIYIEATEAQHPVVDKILEWVRMYRGQGALGVDGTNPNSSGTAVNFRWPDEIDALASSAEPLGISGFDDGLVASSSTVESSKAASVSGMPFTNTSTAGASPRSLPLVCATEDNNLLPYSTILPEYSLLSPEKIACWYSHLAVIRRVANRKDPDEISAAIILEDDIDMEWNIRERLGAVWDLLPTLWDIVFLGHCWSNESYYPALQHFQLQPFTLSHFNSPPSSQIQLHPSHSPKCTHAYVLSPTGARRILLHLLHPPFAYSRAIDQALMWLVRSKRLRSFSVVPSVIVQRKVMVSDIMSEKGMGTGEGGGRGSDWRESLVNGVLQS